MGSNIKSKRRLKKSKNSKILIITFHYIERHTERSQRAKNNITE